MTGLELRIERSRVGEGVLLPEAGEEGFRQSALELRERQVYSPLTQDLANSIWVSPEIGFHHNFPQSILQSSEGTSNYRLPPFDCSSLTANAL